MLIYGLPYQTLDTFKKTIQKTIELNSDRIAIFNFAYVPWLKPIQRRIPEEALTSSSEKLNISLFQSRVKIKRQFPDGYAGSLNLVADNLSLLCLNSSKPSLERLRGTVSFLAAPVDRSSVIPSLQTYKQSRSMQEVLIFRILNWLVLV